MKWKERGMVFMKMINKNYFRYLIRQNKRYLLLIWLISFILTPFLTINFLNNGNGENFGQIVVITSMFGFLISFVVPIYLFTFLQKKKSNILYFSLPIKKESLFITTSCFAIFSTIVPVIVNYLIAIMIKNFFLPASLGSQLFSVILMIIYMLCMESVITVIVLLCQNLLDSYLVSLAYMLVPFLIYGCYKLFLSTLGNNFMLGSGNYTEVFNPMLDYISFIYNGFLQIAYCMDNTVMISSIQIIYWLIVTIGFDFIAYCLFKRRTLEQSENYTRSVFIYPLLITLIIFSLMLAIYHNEFDTNTITFYILIFVFYLLMYFFAIRKVRFTWKMPAVFIALIISCVGFGYIFQSTHGFAIMSEYPEINKQDEFYFSINSKQPFLYKNERTDYMFIDSKNKNTIKLMYEFHHRLLNENMMTPIQDIEGENYLAVISISYDNDVNSTYRSYMLTTEKQIEEYIRLYDEFLNTIETNPQYTCHHGSFYSAE